VIHLDENHWLKLLEVIHDFSQDKWLVSSEHMLQEVLTPFQ
jgi:hypothetical protein